MAKKPQKPSPFTNPLVTLSTGVVIAVVFILLSLVFIIYPTVRSIFSLRETIASETDLLERLNTRATQIRSARALLQTHQVDLNNLNYAFTNEYAYVQDFKIIERIASDVTAQGYNFILLRSSISKMPDEENISVNRSNNPYTRLDATYSISVNADFAGTIAFLKEIKNNRRNFRIDSVNFGTAENGTENLLEVTIVLTNIDYVN